jgi:spore coat protein U-like protein
MKLRLSISSLAAAAGLMLAAGSASATSSTANLGVTADITSTCTISTTTLAFGTYDPIVTNASSALQNSSGQVTITCSNGSSPVITLGQGSNAATGSTDAVPLRRLVDGAATPTSADYLAYTLYQDNGYSTIWGNTSGTGEVGTGDGTSHTYTVYGSIAGNQNSKVGSYTDTVLATVTY